MDKCIVCLDNDATLGRGLRCVICYSDDFYYWKPAPIPFSEIFEDSFENHGSDGCLRP